MTQSDDQEKLADAPSLAYARLKPRRSWLRSWRTLAVVVVIVLVLGGGWSVLSGYGWSAQIRLDTGDLRYCLLGIPLQYDRMSEPQRSAILAISSKSPPISSKWVTCAVFPLPTSNNSHWMCVRYYCEVTAWMDVDPVLARMILEDIADYIETTNVMYSLPESHSMLNPGVVEYGKDGKYRVIDGWENDEGVQLYCQRKGYEPRASEP
ncbi:MAG: hypothetical protein ABIG44_04815 [Planctomycetota bacterium]